MATWTAPIYPEKIKQELWSTFIPGRNPEFKMHSTRAAALNALGNAWPLRRGAMYNRETINHTWSIYIVSPIRKCAHPNCHVVAGEQWSSSWSIERRPNVPVLLKPLLCIKHRRSTYSPSNPEYVDWHTLPYNNVHNLS